MTIHVERITKRALDVVVLGQVGGSVDPLAFRLQNLAGRCHIEHFLSEHYACSDLTLRPHRQKLHHNPPCLDELRLYQSILDSITGLRDFASPEVKLV